MNTVIFILLNGIVLFSSYLLAFRYSHDSHFSEQCIGTFIFFVSQVSLTVLFLGVVLHNVGVISITLLNITISGTIIFFSRRTIIETITQTGKHFATFTTSIFNAKDYLLYILSGLFFIQVIILLVKIYYLPPQVWDVFTYHLHPVVEWFKQGQIPSVIDTPVLRTNVNPLGSKLFHYWFVCFFNDLTWVEIPQFLSGLLLSISSYSIIRKFEPLPYRALRWAILIYFIPTVLIQSRTCQDHLWMSTFILITTLYIITIFYQDKHEHFIFLFLSIGLLLSSKQNAITAVLVLFPAVLICKGFHISKARDFFKANRHRIWTGILLVLALYGYWFGRSDGTFSEYLSYIPETWGLKILPFILIGIPLLYIIIKALRPISNFSILPLWIKKKTTVILFTFLLLGTSILVGTHLEEISTFFSRLKTTVFSFSPVYWNDPEKMNHITANLLSFPIRVKDTASAYTPDLMDISGFGIQFFGFGIIAYAIAGFLFFTRGMKKKLLETYRTGIEGFLFLYPVLLLPGYFLYYYESVSYRLFIFFPVYGIILWASILSKLNPQKKVKLYLDVMVLVMILFSMSSCIFEGNSIPSKWKSMFSMDNDADRTTISFSHQLTGEDWSFIDRYIPPGQPVAYSGGVDSWIFPYYDNEMKRSIYYIETLPGFKTRIDRKNTRTLQFSTLFIETLKHKGIRFLHINPRGVLKEQELVISENEPAVTRICENIYYIN